LLKDSSTYLPFLPELVGGDALKLVLSKHSGKAAIARRLEEVGFFLTSGEISQVIYLVKEASKAAWLDEAALLKAAVAQVRRPDGVAEETVQS
jgi:2-isopropylmalate synthase